MSTRKTIAVDWDGTLVEYNGYGGVGKFGAPIPKMVHRVRRWIAEGHEVIIFTSRVSIEHELVDAMANAEAINKVITSLGLPELMITATKFTRISEFWDDRAVRVEKNQGSVSENLGIV